MSPAALYAAMIAGLEQDDMSPVEIMKRTGVGKTTYYRLRAGECRSRPTRPSGRSSG